MHVVRSAMNDSTGEIDLQQYCDFLELAPVRRMQPCARPLAVPKLQAASCERSSMHRQVDLCHSLDAEHPSTPLVLETSRHVCDCRCPRPRCKGARGVDQLSHWTRLSRRAAFIPIRRTQPSPSMLRLGSVPFCEMRMCNCAYQRPPCRPAGRYRARIACKEGSCFCLKTTVHM